MGEAQKLPYDELIRRAREAFDTGSDFTVAVEEEFALLDPETLALVNRFEEVKEAAAGSAVDANLVGELIASEVEVRTGRCAGFAEASERMGERRAQLSALASELGIALGATGTHPWSRWQDQQIIDTPHYRRNDELLRYVVWRNNTFGLHVHVGIRGADRAARTEIFTRMFPRCGVPDEYGTWAEFESYVRTLYETGSIDEHTQIWWSVRPHLAYPTVEIRICDAQPDLADARMVAAFGYALAARIARAVDEGEPLPQPPPRMIEENLWRAIRYGLSGSLLDPATYDVRPARAEIDRLTEWIAPVADELGIQLVVPATNAAERQIARIDEGWSLEDIYAEQVHAGEVVSG
jgi:carboxylate-amine ligase